MNYNELPEFRKKFKKLARKYRSLPDDLLEFKKVLNQNPLGTSKHFNIITKNDKVVIVKARFFSRYLKGSSLRIIYSYLEKEKLIEFIEIYFKGDQENENRARINNYLKT
jgi:mRNA-degrading endonuclease RelE of RelBE toxin-antitoxin system